ncbi:MAG: flagellar biosynthetic protein FliR [Alphaproteobacteria bacterium]
MLTNYLSFEIFDVFLVFTRLAGAFMVMPGFAASYVNARLRLLLTLTISLLVAPVLSPVLPDKPKEGFELFFLIFEEATTGLFLGLVMVFLSTALDIACDKIGMSIGFRNATAFDPSTSNQSSLINAMLNLAAVCVIFSTGLHHLMITAVVDSYTLFVPGKPILFEDFSQFLVTSVNKSFIIGFKLSAPLIVFSLILYAGLGVMARLMPQLQIFFVSLPLQIYLGSALFMITIPAIIKTYIRYYEDGLVSFLTR